MYTKLLMILSASGMALLGLGATFFPQEILGYCGLPNEALAVLLVQGVGALNLGFAILNWMARTSPIGGIYGRPIGLGNFFHLAVMAVALVKAAIADQHGCLVLGAAAAYSVFAVWFGVVVFVAPKPGSAT